MLGRALDPALRSLRRVCLSARPFDLLSPIHVRCPQGHTSIARFVNEGSVRLMDRQHLVKLYDRDVYGHPSVCLHLFSSISSLGACWRPLEVTISSASRRRNGKTPRSEACPDQGPWSRDREDWHVAFGAICVPLLPLDPAVYTVPWRLMRTHIHAHPEQGHLAYNPSVLHMLINLQVACPPYVQCRPGRERRGLGPKQRAREAIPAKAPHLRYRVRRESVVRHPLLHSLLCPRGDTLLQRL
ncbi:hypothetical protein FB45DRAFT_529999 [Roridomyces roridus]|uniref:Uncharacterized protein n=1 Tax=Roridomyces roridus TaxID=1738132 RepID=A0AAD7F6H8_9AGAR|nr:hypothetical protein FB45DRAFT_529999 [Roridomyces roridus]